MSSGKISALGHVVMKNIVRIRKGVDYVSCFCQEAAEMILGTLFEAGGK